MEFFVSRVYYGFYSVLSFIISVVFTVLTWNDLINKKQGYLLILFLVLVFFLIGIYFYKKSISKKPFIIIDDEKILLANTSESYLFKDLSFYRQETIYAKTSFEYIHFYDNQKDRVFYFNLDEIENKEDLLALIDKKIAKLK